MLYRRHGLWEPRASMIMRQRKTKLFCDSKRIILSKKSLLEVSFEEGKLANWWCVIV